MQITINPPCGGQAAYSSGDVVTGTLTYNSLSQRKCLRRLTLALEVQGYITTDPTSHDGASVDLQHLLCYQERCLIDEPFAVKQPLVWPFSFDIPTTYDYCGRKWKLPPSLSQIFQGTHRRAAFCVMVKYSIRATAKDDSSRRAVHAAGTFAVQQASKTPDATKASTLRIPMTHVCSRVTLCRQMREKLQVMFHITGRPHAGNFQATLCFPKQLYYGQAAMVQCSVQKGMTGPSMKDPSLVLQSFRLRLQGTLQTIAERQVTREYGIYASKDIVRLSLQDKPTTIASNLSIDSFTRGSVHLPDFHNASPYLRHSHFIDVDMEIMEEDTGNVFQLSGRCAVEVLAPMRGMATRT